MDRNISIIAAMANHNVIGMNNQMPWHLPADLAHFKRCTLGKPVVMGRKTFMSIGRALPGRENWVLTRQPGWRAAQANVSDNLDACLANLSHHQEIMVMGGANLYEQCLPLANKMYLTLVDLDCQGDTFFPAWTQSQWQQTDKRYRVKDEKNAYDCVFCEFVRVN